MSSGSKQRRASKKATPSAKSVLETAAFKLSAGQTWAILAVILMIAAGLRFYGIASTPPALYVDEAADGANGVQAWETGNFKVFYPEDNGREGLYINIASVFVHFLGSNAVAVRLPAAIFGFLTVAGLYALTAELISPPVGLAAAFFLATSYWHVNFSRIAFRAIAAPFFLVWALYFLLLALRRRRDGGDFAVWAALAGVLYGLGFHTYIAYRITPLLVILVLSFLFVEASRGGWARRYWIGTSLFTVAAAVVAYPLVSYFVSHPGAANARMNQVSVFGSQTVVHDIVRNIGATVGMLYWQGDANGRHNYAGQPEVFWPVALLMTLGVAIVIRRMFVVRSTAVLLYSALLLLWIVCGAVPAVLSNERLPHALRSILMVPPIAILAAIGAAESLAVVARGIPVPILTAAVIAIAGALAGETAHTYFDLWAEDPQTAAWFDAEDSRMADQINALPAGQAKVVAIDGSIEAADPFFVPLMSIRFLTRSVTPKQQAESNIRYYTPLTFPVPLPAIPGDFCAKATAAMPETIVICLSN
jgi:4-amino-4-deoxy-L-arabinose transferase-like glycosyltransferase